MALACRVDSCFAVPVGFADADAPDDRATSTRERSMTDSSSSAISTEGLINHYGDVRALVDLDLEVRCGEVLLTTTPRAPPPSQLGSALGTTSHSVARP